jgi:hypothetical protein
LHKVYATRDATSLANLGLCAPSEGIKGNICGMEEGATPGQPRSENADTSMAMSTSGWVTTEVAARAIRVSPRTIRRLIQRGDIEAKPQGEGVKRTWLVSIDSLHRLRASRPGEDTSSQDVRDEPEEVSASIAEVLREMSLRLEQRTAEAVEMRTRLELTERTHSTAEEEAKRLKQENERLRKELAAAVQNNTTTTSSEGFVRRGVFSRRRGIYRNLQRVSSFRRKLFGG